MPKTFNSLLRIPTVIEIDYEVKPTESELKELLLLLEDLHREWTEEGASERNQFYSPLLERAEKLFPDDRGNVRVMVPGQRFGRLAFELIKRGFCCEGHESSYLKAACSGFLLDNDVEKNHFAFHPFLHCLNNNDRDEERTRTVPFPDENPRAVLSHCEPYSLVVGNFLDIYKSHSDSWDLIVTCFYADTVPNLICFFEVIFKCLKPGCHWLNFGSLVSYCSEGEDQPLLTPSYQDIRNIIEEIGFIVLEEQAYVSGACSEGSSAIRNTENKNVFLVCRKPQELKASLVGIEGEERIRDSESDL